MSYIHHRLRNMQGMKIFAFFKFIEVFNNIFNKFNHDYDIQLINCLRKRNFRKKIMFIFILLFTLFIHIISMWSYMIGISFVLNDANDFTYMICLKLNFIEFKKAGKILKKKKLLNMITTGNISIIKIFMIALLLFQEFLLLFTKITMRIK